MHEPVPLGRHPAGHLLSVADLGPAGIADVARARAGRSRARQARAAARIAPLAGMPVALLFEKPSLRTRVSFEVGIARLGGRPRRAERDGRRARQSRADRRHRHIPCRATSTRSWSRIHSHAQLAELAAAADVPVVNALTEQEHPVPGARRPADAARASGRPGRAAAGLRRRRQQRLPFAAARRRGGRPARRGSRAREAMSPMPAIVDRGAVARSGDGSRIEIGHDAAAAVAGADAVYTDVWA